MVFSEILEVFYSPKKAFKKIIEEPRLKGPLLILVITQIVAAGIQYVNASKFNLETFVLDVTPIPSEAPYQITAGNFTNPETPHIISIFTFNWTSGSDTVTVYGRNATDIDYEENVTITADYKPTSTSQYFKTVEKIVFSRGGNGSGQYVLLGMRPEEYVRATKYVVGVIMNYLPTMALDFLFTWAMYFGVLLIALKAFRESVDPWSTLFIVVGYTLLPRVIYNLANILLVSMLPTLNLPLEVWRFSAVQIEEAQVISLEFTNQIYQEAGFYSNSAYLLITSSFLGIPTILYIFNVWIAGLWAFAIHSLYTPTWKKAAAISTIAFIADFLLNLFPPLLGIPGSLWKILIIGLLILFFRFTKL